MPPNRAAFFFFLSWGPISDGARQVARARGRSPPWRRRNSLPPSRSNPHRGPQGACPLGEKEVRPESRPSRSPVLQALSFIATLQKCRPTGRHFLLSLLGPHLRWGAPGGAGKGGRSPPWRRRNSLPPSRSNPHRGPQRASPLGRERSTA